MPLADQEMARRRFIEEILRAEGLYPGVQGRHLGKMARRSGTPSKNENGSFRWILTSEAPTTVFDWAQWDFIDEVLLMEGLIVPTIQQVPLQDSHSRRSVRDNIGSVRDFQIVMAGEYGAVDGAVSFAADQLSQDTMQKVIDGHLTDGSIGYEVIKSVWLPEGEEAMIKGKVFIGPLKVSYLWSLKEFSVTPIGADPLAKVRSLCKGVYRSGN